MCGTRGILVGSSFFGIVQLFPCFSMTIILDGLHMIGILSSMKHVFSILIVTCGF